MNWIKSTYEKYREQISYLFWGGMTTIVSYGSYFFFSRITRFDPLVANVCSWICAVAFAYVTNKIFVFRSKSWVPKDVATELWKFVSARIFSFVLEMGIMFVFVTLLHFNDILIKIIASVIVVILNYVFSKVLIFKKPGETGH